MEEGGENGEGRWKTRGEKETKCKHRVCREFLNQRHVESDLMEK